MVCRCQMLFAFCRSSGTGPSSILVPEKDTVHETMQEQMHHIQPQCLYAAVQISNPRFRLLMKFKCANLPTRWPRTCWQLFGQLVSSSLGPVPAAHYKYDFVFIKSGGGVVRQVHIQIWFRFLLQEGLPNLWRQDLVQHTGQGSIGSGDGCRVTGQCPGFRQMSLGLYV